MNALKYLRRSLPKTHQRPGFTWGYRFQDSEGRWVVVTSDGYRLHAVWTDNVKSLPDGTIPFNGSQPFGETTPEKAIQGFSKMLQEATAREYTCQIAVGVPEIRARCKAELSSGAFLVIGTDVLFMDNASHGLFHLRTGTVRAAPERACINVTPSFIRQAVFDKKERLLIRFTPGEMTPILVGEIGVRAAIIMPRSGARDGGVSSLDSPLMDAATRTIWDAQSVEHS